MKLISCYIKGFGALENLSIDFSEHVHCIYEKNGYGKSTLFYFIQAMLYGMRTRKANAANMLPREHYKPFNASHFGGELAIEAEGRTFYIKRIFHEKSETKDTCTIIDEKGADVTSQFPSDHNLGQYFFGIDEDAFKRTVAFTGQTFNSGAGENETISQKLNTMATSVDPKKKENAINALKEQMDGIAKRGKNPGRIVVINNEISGLNNEIARLEAIAEGLPDKHELLNKKQGEHKAYQDKIERFMRTETLLAKWDTYERMQVGVQDKAREKEHIDKKYPDTTYTPTMQEIEKLERLQNDKHTAETSLMNLLLANEDVPSEEKMAEIARLSQVYKSNELRLQAIASTPQTEKSKTAIMILGVLTILSALYAVSVPSVIAMVVFAALIALTAILSLGKSSHASTEGVEIKRRNTVLENDLREFFCRYKKYGTDYKAYYDELCRDIRQYNECLAKKETATKLLNEMLSSLNIPLEDLNISRLRITAVEYANNRKRSDCLSEEISRDSLRIEKYREENKLTTKPIKDDDFDIESLKEADKQLMADITRLSDDIKEDEYKVAETDFLLEKRNSLENERTALTTKLEIIEKTIYFIETANKNMLETYIGPIRDKYVGYMMRLLPRLSSVTMDHNYNISFHLKDDKMSRSSEHLSTGERTCMELALRLALIENMYKKERPFLIMDDPFADLDEENLEKAKNIVKAVSNKTQILYFCCFQSRQFSI